MTDKLLAALAGNPELLVMVVSVAGLLSLLKYRHDKRQGNGDLRKLIAWLIGVGGLGVTGLILIIRETSKLVEVIP